MIQSVTSNISAQALRQLSVSSTRATETQHRLSTGTNAPAPVKDDAPNTNQVITSSINPLAINSGGDSPKPTSFNGTGRQPIIDFDRETGIYSNATGDLGNEAVSDNTTTTLAMADVRQQLAQSMISKEYQTTSNIMTLFR